MGSEPLISIGVVTRPHGRKGELRVKILTDFPDRFSLLERVYLTLPGRIAEYEVSNVRYHQGFCLMQLVGIDSIEEANKWALAYVQILQDEVMPLPEGAYYIFDLIGCSVVTDAGVKLGEIVDVLTTAANDVYVVQGEGEEILLPATKEVVKNIDLSNRSITVSLLPGILD
ncbi:MAG: ribosome maturation factor RimM [Limnochordia bacterium]|nr:ribosome maturation factor RimM [Limnochordia bacterium]MDD2628660.1 ribosome maturation factor RimM [Limnochordia bacterium]MDD4516901.1 ribosome maturation factor RimM [Limnochordia bacterium]